MFFITPAFPPNPVAASVVHYNLLRQFNPESFILLVAYFIKMRRSMRIGESFRIHRVFVSLEYVSGKLQRVVEKWLQKICLAYCVLLARWYKPVIIVASYPDIFFLSLGRKVSERLRIPFIPYLHDTLAESNAHKPIAAYALREQEKCFAQAEKVAVMSDGMADLYRKKYQMEALVWQHQFVEDDLDFSIPVVKKRQAFWAGDVYDINGKSFKRVSDALGELGVPLIISGPKPKHLLEQEMHIRGPHIQQVFFPRRHDYLHALAESEILILCLDWPDESVIHEDELATIFPTKTVEYLRSGSKIFLHCPVEYFLYRKLAGNARVFHGGDRDNNEIRAQLINHLGANVNDRECEVPAFHSMTRGLIA